MLSTLGVSNVSYAKQMVQCSIKWEHCMDLKSSYTAGIVFLHHNIYVLYI